MAFELDPAVVQDVEQRRVLNIKAAYDLAKRAVAEVLLFDNEVKRRHDTKLINTRQYAIVTQVLAAGRPVPLTELRAAPWYTALYAQRTDKTRQRDLRGLREQGLLLLDRDKALTRLRQATCRTGALKAASEACRWPTPPRIICG